MEKVTPKNNAHRLRYQFFWYPFLPSKMTICWMFFGADDCSYVDMFR